MCWYRLALKFGDIGGWSSATSCAKKKRRQKKRREKVGKRVVCATVVRVYPMIGNSASEKPENLILPFARGTTRDSFPDQRTARLVGWPAVIQRPPRKTIVNNIVMEREREKTSIFDRFVETKGEWESGSGKKKGEKREEEYPSTLSLANSSFISFLPLFCALISFLFFSLFPSSSDLMHPMLVFNPWRKDGLAREGNYYPGGW